MAETPNFGNFQNITISGYKWDDRDGNGQWDGGELALNGWTIYLDSNQDGSPDEMIMTDADGRYEFTNLGPGRYRVTEQVRAGWTNTYDGSTTIMAESGMDQSGQFETTELLNFGNRQAQSGNVTGIKFHDENQDADRDGGEPIIAGWQIRAYADNGNGFLEQDEFDGRYVAAVLTDQDTGLYAMDLEPGHYILVEVLWSGWAQSAPIRPVLALNLDTGGVPLGPGGHAITVIGGETYTDLDFGNYQTDCSFDHCCVVCCCDCCDDGPEPADFGDAPTGFGDASHTIIDTGPILGVIGPDAEVGSQYSVNADGDDLNGSTLTTKTGSRFPITNLGWAWPATSW